MAKCVQGSHDANIEPFCATGRTAADNVDAADWVVDHGEWWIIRPDGAILRPQFGAEFKGSEYLKFSGSWLFTRNPPNFKYSDPLNF